MDVRRRRPPRAARSELAAMAPRRPRDGDDPSNPSVYEGERDAEGRPHGRGRMRLDDEGVWHEGRFVRGARHGRGTLRFPPDEYEPGRRGGRDSESDSERSTRRDASRIPRRPDDHDFPVGGDRLAGTFVEGVLHGPAVYHSADGSSRKARMCTASSPAWSRVRRERRWCSAAITRTAGAGDGVLRQPDGSVVVSYWHEGTQGEGSSSTRARMACPSTRRSKIKSRRSAAGTDATRGGGVGEARGSPPRQPRRRTSAARRRLVPVRRVRSAARRADALAGGRRFREARAFGVVRAGSCWARFDEFEGSSSGTPSKKGEGLPRTAATISGSIGRRCFFARVAAARAARLARTLRDARSSDDSEARGSRCTLRRLARAARSIAAGARERARERNERRGSDRRLFASGGSRSGSSRAERDRRLHRLGRSSGLRAARRVSSRLRAGFAVEPPRPHILRARASPGRAGGSPGRSRRRLRRGGRRR